MRCRRSVVALTPGLILAAIWLSSGCTNQSPSNPFLPNTALTPDTHSRFPINAGAHANMDCNSCHGDFSSFTQFTCVSCHTHDQTISDPLHTSVAGYTFSGQSCYTCHPDGSRRPFDHSGVSGGCANCHDVAAPFAALPVTGFTHPPMNGNDCGACHDTRNWADGNAPAGLAVDPRKDLTVQALIPSYAGPSIASLSPQVETLVMPMNHAASQVAAPAFSACANCHSNASSGTYYPGTFHSALANLGIAEPSSCSDCHAATPTAAGQTMPTGFVGPVATNPARSPSSGEMKHDAVAWASGAPTSTTLVPGDCGVCHASPSHSLAATWATGVNGVSPALFHAALVGASQPQPTSCLDCHANSRPDAVLTSSNSSLPAGLSFDHASAPALADCVSCHASTTAWSGGRFHLAGSSTPTSCLPCHSGERPTSTSNWINPGYATSPFDYVPNSQGITHGDGQDCAACHGNAGTGAWGGTQNWASGHFLHGATTVANTTCAACHSTQRPDLQPGTTAAAAAALLNFDHSINGTGDCYGCHQATVAAGTYVNYDNPATGKLPGGDWKGGVGYPGSVLIASQTQFVTTVEINLVRTGSLVTGMSSISATLYNEMLHTSSALPPELNAGTSDNPDYGKCWHCHTNDAGTVKSYKDGLYHPSLASYSATPGGTVVAFPQPTTLCTDCHTQTTPTGIVERSASDLVPMDHGATFTAPVNIGGVSASGVADLACAACHHSPLTTWADGSFHADIAAAVPTDCTGCHYPLMADAVASDVTVDPTYSTSYSMKHRSGQLTIQNCQACHINALGSGAATPVVATLWKGGGFHAYVPSRPTSCTECHAVSSPASVGATQSSWTYSFTQGGTSSNSGQWMNHDSTFVKGVDCVVCHSGDATPSGSAWSKADQFHQYVPGVSACQACHGLTNGGGSTPGTNNNMPVGLTDSSTQSTAGNDPTTGVPSGTVDQVCHLDINATNNDCGLCHTQVGISTAAGIQGKEWAQGSFHKSFSASNPIVMNWTTGRCSNCHMNLIPGSSFTAQSHATFNDVSGSLDCSACHSWPGTGTPSAPNWLGATSVPQYISVGQFPILQPPASTPTIQPGIHNLPHPTVASGEACTTCHAQAAGGRNAFGYDHASALINNNCGACHEAGSDLVGTIWNGATSQSSAAGDTRSFTLTGLTAQDPNSGGASCSVTNSNHFYPADCSECHVAPSGNSFVTGGAAYLNGTQGAWAFAHNTTKMTNPTTCNMCHSASCPEAPANHPLYFPIDPASQHAAVTCIQCHTDLAHPTVATNFACGTCHLSLDPALISKHTTTTSNSRITVPANEINSADSSTCLRCHADSQVDLTSAHTTGREGDPPHEGAGCLTCHDLYRTDKTFGADFGTTGPLLAGCTVHGCAHCHPSGCNDN